MLKGTQQGKTLGATVRITWYGQGGELDSVTVKDVDEHDISRALVKMIQGNVVAAGDSFTVEEIETKRKGK